MRRILIAVPLKGQMSSYFVKNLIETCRLSLPDTKIDFSFLEGAPTAQARNEIADYAMLGNYNELVQLDKDIDASAENVIRLLSHHDAPIVCTPCCQRSLDTFWHLQTWSKTQKPTADGLLRVRQCSIAFSKIRVEVFHQLAKDNPDRAGILTTTGGDAKPIVEFYPTELVGPNTPAARLESVRRILEDYPDKGDESGLHRELTAAIETHFLEENLHTAEDYNFCRLCRASGIPIMIDTRMAVQHETGVMLPIPTEQLEKMLSEAWRK